MAKIGLTKLGLSKDKISSVSTIEWNEQTIEIKKYLPINDKLVLISNIINSALDDNNFYNPLKVELFSMLAILENYTNLSFTEKQKEDPCKLYDLLESNGLINAIINVIPKEEYETIIEAIEETIKSIYNYNNSVYGILDNIQRDYSNLNLDASEIQQKINNPENLTLLKDIMTKLG